MPTISDQLTALIVQKNNLVDNLNSKGVTASRSEKLNTLVPKVLQINSGGGLDTSDATATSNDILLDKTAYVKGNKVTGSIKSKATATYVPSTEDQIISSGQYLSGNQTIKGDENLLDENIKTGITLFEKVGTFTSDATAASSDILLNKTAYVNGEKITGIIPSKDKQTFTPSTEDQIISSGQYLSGVQTVLGDSNLLPENIKTDVTIFGVTGIHAGVSELTEATVTNGDIKSGKIAYGNNGEKIIGNAFTLNAESSITPDVKDHYLKPGFYNGITVQGDTNLVPANIKNGVNIFGVTGVYEGGGGSTESEQIIFECDPEATDTEIVETWGNLIKTKMGDVYDNLKTYVYNTISAISYNANNSDLISGICYKIPFDDSSSTYGFYFISQVNITSSTVLLYIRGYISPWIKSKVIIHFIESDSIDDIPTKINNEDYAYSKKIEIPNAINSTHNNITSLILYFNLDNMTLSGKYYLYIEVVDDPNQHGNDYIMNKIVLVNK